jgi:hypothetical protein
VPGFSGQPTPEQWIDLSLQPMGFSGLATGDTIEIVTRTGGVIDGTALVEIRISHGQDHSGAAFGAEFLGCVKPEHAALLGLAFPSFETQLHSSRLRRR